MCVGIVDWKSVSPDVRKSYRVEFELTRCVEAISMEVIIFLSLFGKGGKNLCCK